MPSTYITTDPRPDHDRAIKASEAKTVLADLNSQAPLFQHYLSDCTLIFFVGRSNEYQRMYFVEGAGHRYVLDPEVKIWRAGRETNPKMIYRA